MRVYSTDPNNEFYTAERCHIIEILNDRAHPGISIAQARVDPGVTTQLHALSGIEEIYYVLEGEGSLMIDGESRTMRKGDCIVIGKGKPQSIRNSGNGLLIFLCICRPAFQNKNYKELGP